MSGYNLPDGCLYPSDLDAADAQRGWWDRPDDDPTPEEFEQPRSDYHGD